MKKTEFNEFADFVMDEATRYGRSITKPEIETYFENFPSVSLREFRAGWVEHKRHEKRGQYFPTIVDLQRALRTGNEGDASKHDHRCLWNGEGMRCKYPVGFFEIGKTEGFCIFHRSMMSGAPAQAICEESQTASAEEYLVRARKQAYGDTPPRGVLELRERIAQRAAGGNFGVLSTKLLAGFSGRGAADDELDAINRRLREEAAEGAA